MTIKQLDERKVLISLGCDDMKNFDLEFDKMSFYSEHSKKVLLRLLKLACMKAGLSHKRKSVLMEALPYDRGCLILVTMIEENRPKTYKVKNVSRRAVFVFEGAEELLSAAQDMYTRGYKLRGNSLWLLQNSYYLIPEAPLLRRKVREILGLYGTRQNCTQVQLARIKERGKLLQEGNALEYIGRKILEQSS